jgi:ABC-2 type transport system permease protein
MTGVGTLLRTFARRDRWFVFWFLVGTTVLYWSQAVSVDGLYKTQAEFDRAAASMEGNAAFIAMAGPARALNTTGGQVTWQAAGIGAIVVALMVMFLVGRHTRVEEETGRDELLRAGAIARTAPMVAAGLEALLASAVVGLGVSLSLVGYGLPAAGAWSLGVGLALCGAAFAAIALLAAQLTASARSMYGLVGAALGIAYALRAIGDVGNGVLSWFSPIGWYQAMHAYSGERWWPALLLMALAALGWAAAYAVFHRRDFGAGVVAARPGPARASRSLASGLGLAVRLQRGSLLGWTIGMFVGGLGYGSIGDDVDTLIGDSSFSKDVFTAGGGPDLVDAFYAVAVLMLVLIASGFTVSSALRPRGEEEAGRIEALLATALPRRTWLLGHLSVTLVGTLVVLLAAGLGLGTGYALVTGDGSAVLRLTGATFALLPGILLLGALARLLAGAVPRWASLAWLGTGFCAVVMLFGTALRFPTWLVDLSPFSHLAAVPAESMSWAAFVVVLVLAVCVSGAGVAAFERRDLR